MSAINIKFLEALCLCAASKSETSKWVPRIKVRVLTGNLGKTENIIQTSIA